VNLPEGVNFALGLSGLAGVVFGVWRKGVPWARARALRQRSMDEVILGRPEIPGNPITGEPARKAIPPLGDRLDQLSSQQEFVIAQMHANAQQQAQLDRIEAKQAATDQHIRRIDSDIAEMKSTLVDTMHSAAEANRHLLPTIETAIKATPPPID
jgi:small-conductance mechanosensitive channel